MKKYGKFEKRPVAPVAPVTEKQPKVRNMLLQTYFTSLLCLVLCVTMFFGTSYAWFSSEVTNATNEIYIGTLDVGLFKQGDAGQVDLSTGNNKLFDGNIRWEPGYTSLETIYVVNEGDLAFKYVLSFTEGQGDAANTQSLETIAKYFDVWVYDHLNKGAPVVAKYKDITADGSGWENVGTLDQLLAGGSVLDGIMVTVRATNQDGSAGESVPTTDTYTIALHMNENADFAVMGQKISLTVKLVAYQMASESDDLGYQYDNISVVTDADGLKTSLTSGGNTVLMEDVAIKTLEDTVTMNGGVLDGNGETITYSGTKSATGSVGVVNTTGGTVKNLTVTGSENGRALYSTQLTSDLNVTDCTFSGAYAFNLNSSVVTDYTLNFTNTVFNSWTSYANVMKHAYFTNCSFAAILRPYGDSTLTNCSFAIESLDVSHLEANETVTLVNCTYKGTVIENAVITKAEDGTVTVSGSDLLTVSTDKLIVLK